MKCKYDKKSDIIYITLTQQPVAESDEDKPGIIIDYDADGFVVGMEILNASKRIPNPNKFEYETSDTWALINWKLTGLV